MSEEDKTGAEDSRLEALQEAVKDTLKETTFGKPMKVSAPGGQTLVFRRRQYEGRPDSGAYETGRSEQRKAVTKRSKAMGESWKKFVEPGKRSLTERKPDSIKGKFPLAYELVEYVSAGGTVNNVARMMELKPPTIHGIEDIADSVDWHFLNRGITVEHLETALSKGGDKVLVFMDDRAAPRLPQVKEVLSKFGEARILQRADDMSEHTGQPHGFYVFELSPDQGIYQKSTGKDDTNKELSWNADRPQTDMVDSMQGAINFLTDSVEDDELVEVVLEDLFEPFCGTCGDQLFEASEMEKFKPSEVLKRRTEGDRAKRKAGTTSWKKTAFAPKGVYDSVDGDFVEESYKKWAGIGAGVTGVASGVEGYYTGKKKGLKGKALAKHVAKFTGGGAAAGAIAGVNARALKGTMDTLKPVKDSLEDDEFDFVEMCGKDHDHADDKKKKKNNPNTDDDYDDEDDDEEFDDWKSSEAFDAKVGDPKGKKKKDHKVTLGDSEDSYKQERKRKLASRVGSGAATGAALGAFFGKRGYKSVAAGAAGFGAYGGLRHLANTQADYKDYEKSKSKSKKESLDYGCGSCGAEATAIDEHEFNGHYCARHGDRLDKYTHACSECVTETHTIENTVVACPECQTTVTMEESECGVCGTAFDDGVADFAEHVAESVLPFELDEDVTLREHDWTDSFASQLADSLFSDVEDDTLPF